MNKSIFSVFLVINLFLSTFAIPLVIPAFQTEAYAQAKAPTYITGGANVKTRMTAKGKSATELIALLAVMVGTGGLIGGAIKLGMNNKQGGKELIIGGASCLLIVGMAYGVVTLLIK